VLSHPVALGQCRIWLEAHLPNAELVGEWDTAGSAEIVAREGRLDQAAIAPLAAIGAYGLGALAERIEDDPSNQTRFLTFTRSAPPADPSLASVRRKTSLLLWLPHKPGMLSAALQAFASRGVNLTSLQSRPERTAPWTYRFYLDVEGAPDEPRLAEAIESAEALVTKLVSSAATASGTTERRRPPRRRRRPRTTVRSRTSRSTTAGSGPRGRASPCAASRSEENGPSSWRGRARSRARRCCCGSPSPWRRPGPTCSAAARTSRARRRTSSRASACAG
jgi:hypothetical protein